MNHLPSRAICTLTLAVTALVAAAVSARAYLADRGVAVSCKTYVSFEYMAALVGAPIDLVLFGGVAILVAAHLLYPVSPRWFREHFFNFVLLGSAAVLGACAPGIRVLMKVSARMTCAPCLIAYAALVLMIVIAAAAPRVIQAAETALTPRHRRWFPVAAGSFGVVPILLLGFAGTKTPARPGSATQIPRTDPEVQLWVTSASRQPTLDGRAEGRVLITEFVDYECPYCKKAYLEYRPLFETMQSGEARDRVLVEVRDFPLSTQCNRAMRAELHPLACEAAAAVHLARRNGRASQMRAWLYDNQGDLSSEVIRRALGEISPGQRNENPGEASESIKKDVEAALAVGVSGTPALFVNGIRIPNGSPVDRLEAVVRLELGSLGR
jgi:protein-disulfide isomerase